MVLKALPERAPLRHNIRSKVIEHKSGEENDSQQIHTGTQRAIRDDTKNKMETTASFHDIISVPDISANDSHNLVSVLDEMLTKLHHISQIGEFNSINTERLKNFTTPAAGKEVSQFANHLLQHVEIEKIAKQFVDESGKLREHTDKQARHAASEIAHSTSILARELYRNRCIRVRLDTTIIGEPNSDMIRFVEIVANLREIVIGNLKRIAKGQQSNRQVLETVMSKEHSETSLVKHLDEQLRTMRTHNASTLDACNRQLTSLTKQIDVSDFEAKRIRAKLKRNMHTCMEVDGVMFDNTVLKYREDIAKQDNIIQTLRDESSTTEEVLHRRKVNAELNVQRAIARFDKEIGELQAETIALNAQHEIEKQRIKTLTQHFVIVDKEKARIAECKRIEKARKQRLECNLRLWFCAAMLIQRRLMKIMRSNKGGKKKGAKSKGKSSGKKKK